VILLSLVMVFIFPHHPKLPRHDIPRDGEMVGPKEAYPLFFRRVAANSLPFSFLGK